MKTVISIAAFLLMASPLAAVERDPSGGLWLERPGEVASWSEEIVRARPVEVLESLITRPTIDGRATEAGEDLLLELFDGEVLSVGFENWERARGGGHAWIGRFSRLDGEGRAIFVVRGDVVVGTLRGPGTLMQLRRHPEHGEVLVELDSSSFPDEGPDDAVPVYRNDEAESIDARATRAPGSPTIDLLVLYTPAVLDLAGSQSTLDSYIDLVGVELNTAYADSGAGQRVRTVHSAEVDYVESGSTSTDLPNLAGIGDGFLEEAHTLRDTYGADAVILWIASGGCGRAYLMTSISSGFEDSAFGVVSFSCAIGNLSQAHELGHNMGLRHDWYVDEDTTPFTSSHGYAYPPGSWRTILAYNDFCSASGGGCTRVGHFSNPSVDYSGAPTGVAAGTSIACTEGNVDNPECDADAVGTLAAGAATFAAFRDTEVIVTIDKAVSAAYAEIGETIDYTLTITNDSNETAVDVVVSDVLAAGVTLDLGSTTGSWDGSTLSWDDGTDLAPGATLVLDFSVTVDQGGFLSNVATVTASNQSLVISSNTVTTAVTRPAGCGFNDGFENGLGIEWQTDFTLDGRVRVVEGLAAEGTAAAILDDAVGDSIESEAGLILTADLAAAVDPVLDFSWADLGDEYDAAFDGVFIRESSLDAWIKVFDFSGDLNGIFQDASLDLESEASGAGITVGDGFQIRFGFMDNYYYISSDPSSGDGYAIDAVVLDCSGLVCDDTLSSQTVSGILSVSACGTLTVGPSVTVESGAQLSLSAGQRIAVGNGFRVEVGSEVAAEIDVSLLP